MTLRERKTKLQRKYRRRERIYKAWEQVGGQRWQEIVRKYLR